MHSQEGRLYGIALVVLRADSMKIKRLEYQDLVMQSGPLPSYSFGVLLDAAKSTVGCESKARHACMPMHGTQQAAHGQLSLGCVAGTCAPVRATSGPCFPGALMIALMLGCTPVATCNASLCSRRGDVSTTIAFTTSQKTALTSSTTSGKEISASLGVTLKTDILPIPEYSVEVSRANSLREEIFLQPALQAFASRIA